jgi:hypothetical protein
VNDKGAKNEKLYKSEWMWYINSLENELEETICYI